MDKEMLEQFQMLAQGMTQMEKRFEQIDEQFQIMAQGMTQMEKRMMEQIDLKIRESETRTRVFIENSVTSKIEALFDGYKLTHEKQWELERKVEKLEERVERLEQVG